MPDSHSAGPAASGPHVHRLNISGGGVPKTRIPEAHITFGGVEGDRQANRKHHGGPERAVCLFSLEAIHRLQAEGHPIEPGSTGENLTVCGLDWSRLAPGDRLQIGSEVVLEISSYTTPCKTISGSFLDGRFVRVSQKVHPGESRLYARVICPGHVREGDPIRTIPQ